MRSIFILAVIAVLSSCNNQPPSQTAEPGTSTLTDSNPADHTDVSVDMIKNPSTSGDPNAQPGEFPVISFKNDYFDFGDMVEGQVVETTFEFTNTGKTDLLINRCDASCGCTVPDWPKEPIKPGKSGKIKVKFDSSGKSGVNNKIVTVVSNTREGTAELKFRANVQAVKKQSE